MNIKNVKLQFILLPIVLSLFFITCLGQQKANTTLNKIKPNENCSVNNDGMYNRQKVLQKFADVLNSSIPEFEKVSRFKFYVENEKAAGFEIYDLSDKSISSIDLSKNCVEFTDNHIYHVVPSTYDYSFSHIIVLENENLKVFKSINCQDRGDKIEDVITYLNLKLVNDENKIEILERVKNYRKYGTYARMDNFSRLTCKERINTQK